MMAMIDPASEFIHNIRRHRMRAQREVIAALIDGRITSYFIESDGYEQFRRDRDGRRNSAMIEPYAEVAEALHRE